MGVGFGGGGGGRVFKAIFGGVLLVVFVWLLFAGILASEETMGGEAATKLSSKLGDDVMLVRKMRHYVAVNHDLIYSNKRKVPSGPDPFHNRHFWETKRPPGHVQGFVPRH